MTATVGIARRRTTNRLMEIPRMRVATLCLIFSVAVADLAADEPKSTPVVVPRAEQIDVKSKGGREYRLFVQAPPKEDTPPAGGYPVYYFTDANASFPLVASLARIQQPTVGSVVLVGIGYPTDDRDEITTRRSFDLTPAADPEAMKKFQEARKADPNRPRKDAPARAVELKFGGQAEFFAFVQDEVKPLVEKRFKIDKGRQALFGHSFGGLFTLYALYAHPDSFQTFVAASPSLWLNPVKLAEDEAAFTAKLKESKGAKPKLLLTLGELEARAATGKEGGESNPHAELIKRLKETGLDATFKQFEGENHGSVVPFAHMRGLRFAFEGAPRPAR